MTSPAPFGRMLTAMATAFTDDGAVDLDATAAIAVHLVEHGHDGVVVSGLEHLVKPDPRLYRVFCERYGLAPESCVFIDDSEANVVSARKFGMHAVHFTDAKTLRKELIGLGLPLKAK